MINNIIHTLIVYFNLDFWTFWGFAGQSFFFLRVIIQWVRSEQEKKTVIPLSFWWLGIIGAIMLFVYAIIRRDLVFLITSVLQLVIYFRNYVIAVRSEESPPIE